MYSFFERLAYKFRLFMRGRYGMDMLSHFATVCSLIFLVLSSLFGILIFYILGIVLLFLAYYRCFSKNLDKRGRELCAYLKYRDKVRGYINRRKKMFRDRKYYKFFKCKNCGTYSRVPKGKGKIKITCGVCKSTMIKRT